MAFDIFPPDGPLAVEAAASSAPLPITPRFGSGEMIISVVRVTAGNPTPPTVALQVGTGPVLALSQTGATSLTASDAVDAPIVADVDLLSAADDVFAFEILPRVGQQPDAFPWTLQITNHDAVSRRAFRWVVADTEAESRQPLVTVDPITHLDAIAGHPAEAAIGVANHGTGTLTVTTAVGTDLGGGFTLTAVPDPISPNAGGAITVTYQPPTGLPRGGSAFAATSYTFATNDPRAGQPDHTEARAGLTAATRAPLWNAGDILMTDPRTGDGTGTGALLVVDPQTGRQAMVSVGQSFVSPAGVTLDLDGNALIADPSAKGISGAVIRIDRITAAQTVVSSGQLFSDPSAVVVTPQGRIVVADSSAFGRIGGLIEVEPTTGKQTKLASGAPLQNPVSLAVHPQTGALVVLNGEGSPQGVWLSTVTLQGQVTAFATAPVTLDAGAAGLAVDDDGRVLLALPGVTAAGAQVVAVGPDGAFTTLSQGLPLRNPVRVRRDRAGTLHVMDWPDDTIGTLLRAGPAGEMSNVTTAGVLHRPLDLVVVPAEQ
jgi:sugar lactone lactonase YvrE